MNFQLFPLNTKRIFTVLMLLTAFFSTGCTKKIIPTYLVPIAGASEGYKAEGSRAKFEKDGITISIKALGPHDKVDEGLLTKLKKKNFIFIELTFLNNTEKEIRYSTSFTHIIGAHFDYRKPLNYTDLYSIVVGKSHDLSQENEMKKLKGRYYDHSTSIPPKSSVTKFLIFKPNKEETKQAVLTMKEIYNGIKTFSVVFPFEAVDVPETEIQRETKK